MDPPRQPMTGVNGGENPFIPLSNPLLEPDISNILTLYPGPFLIRTSAPAVHHCMPPGEHPDLPFRQYLTDMSSNHSQIPDTARAVNRLVLSWILSYLESVQIRLAAMPLEAPLVIADDGAADGANSSQLFESIIEFIHAVNPSLAIRLIYMDIADPVPFHRFWERSHRAALENVSAEYRARSTSRSPNSRGGCTLASLLPPCTGWIQGPRMPRSPSTPHASSLTRSPGPSGISSLSSGRATGEGSFLSAPASSRRVGHSGEPDRSGRGPVAGIGRIRLSPGYLLLALPRRIPIGRGTEPHLHPGLLCHP